MKIIYIGAGSTRVRLSDETTRIVKQDQTITVPDSDGIALIHTGKFNSAIKVPAKKVEVPPKKTKEKIEKTDKGIKIPDPKTKKKEKGGR